jgi:Fic family protein
MTIHYVSSRLENVEIFNEDDVAKLRLHASAHPLATLTSSPRWKEESAIDFTYTSAQIEGNTYTRADTITLLKEGITAGGKTFYEATMILNLRDTYRIVLDRAADIVADPLEGIRAIHKSLMKGLLPEDQLGTTRKTTNARIGGTEYIPPDGVQYIEKQAARIFENIGKTSDPFSASIYAACNLSYIQFFEDGNKRTSRVFQNAVLMAADLPPLQFPVSMNAQYVEAQLAYYEQGDYSFHRGFMVQAFKNAYPLEPQAQPNTSSSFIGLLKGQGETPRAASPDNKP